MAFAPDGHVGHGSGDDTVTLWDLTDPDRPQQIVRSPNDSDAAAGVVRCTADGRTLATEDGTAVRLWDLTTLITVADHALGRACAVTDGGLDPGEWDRLVPVLPYEDSCLPVP